MADDPTDPETPGETPIIVPGAAIASLVWWFCSLCGWTGSRSARWGCLA